MGAPVQTETELEQRDALIREAYDVLANPEHLFDLQLKVARAGESGDNTPEMLAPHIEQVRELFDRVHFSDQADFAGLSLGPAPGGTPRPDTLLCSLDEALKVVDPGSELDLEKGKPLPDYVTGHDQARRQKLRRFTEGREAKRSMILRIYQSPQDSRGAPVIVTPRVTDGRQCIELHRLNLAWEESIAGDFAAGMGLSGAESELVRYLVEGRSLADFADDRARSLGTARNQLKATMRKLGVTSQSELVALYAGYSEAWRLRQMGPHGGVEDESASTRSVRLAEGSEQAFERRGLEGGIPVLVLHGAIEGPFLPPDIEQRARVEGFDLIIPWMPFYSAPSAFKNGIESVDQFAHRARQFLDRLGIDRCLVLATSFSAVYAYGVRAHLGDRVVGLLLTGSPIPMGGRDQVASRNTFWRAPLLLARTSPVFLEVLVRAVVRLSMRGEAHRYYDRLLENSPRDRETLRRPDVQAMVRRAFLSRPDRAARGMATGLVLLMQDWSRWLSAAGAPVTIMVGEEDTIHDHGAQTAHASKYGFAVVGPVAGAGAFLLFQRPGLVFEHLREMAARL